MMPYLVFAFAGFWRFIGCAILLGIVAEVPASIVRALRGLPDPPERIQ